MNRKKRAGAKRYGDGKRGEVPVTDVKKTLLFLADAYDHYGIVSWLSRAHPGLGGRTPLAAIDDGDSAKVVELAKAASTKARTAAKAKTA